MTVRINIPKGVDVKIENTLLCLKGDFGAEKMRVQNPLRGKMEERNFVIRILGDTCNVSRASNKLL